MKKRLLALILAMALLFSGCASIFQRSYTSSTEHTDYTGEEDSSVLRAESYRGLVDAVLYFVNEHQERGVVRLYNYTSDVDADLTAAIREVTREDPLGAYAVERITYECARIVSYYEVTVSIIYSHTQEEIDDILPVTGTAAIREALEAAMAGFVFDLTLRVSYFSGDEESLRTMASQAYYATPQAAFGMPEVGISLYPDSGVQRIVELTLRWPGDKKSLEMRSAELIATADQFLADNPPGESGYTAADLAGAFSLIALPEDPGGSDDPSAVFTGAPATQLARTLALELLCHRAGVKAVFVSGFFGGTETSWIITETAEGFRHLLLTPEGVLLCSDEEVTALGYLWLAELYPNCPAPELPPETVQPDPVPEETDGQ